MVNANDPKAIPYIITEDNGALWYVADKAFDPSKGFTSVSAKGVANGLSTEYNDGADFGPDSYNPDHTGSGIPYTQTSGINEALLYLNETKALYNESPAVLLNSGVFTIDGDINFLPVAPSGEVPPLYGVGRHQSILNFKSGSIKFPTNYTEDWTLGYVGFDATSDTTSTEYMTLGSIYGDLHFIMVYIGADTGVPTSGYLINLTETYTLKMIDVWDNVNSGASAFQFTNVSNIVVTNGRALSPWKFVSSNMVFDGMVNNSTDPYFTIDSASIVRLSSNTLFSNLRSPVITPNPPVSGTSYRNNNPYDIMIYLPIYTSTSGTAGNIKASIGTTSTPATQVINDIVNSGTTSSNPRTIVLKVPAGWYYEFVGTTTTFGTAVVVAD